MNPTPNPGQPHASILTQATAKTLAELGMTLDDETATLLIQAVGGDVRFTVNGTAPTASSGIKIADGNMIQLGRNEAGVAKFITGSSSPKLEIASYQL